MITGMDKLRKLTRKQLKELSKQMGVHAKEFVQDCLLLTGKGEEQLRSGDSSEVELDLGDKQFWSLSYGFWGDEPTAMKVLKAIGVEVTAKSGYDIRVRYEKGSLSKIEALIRFGLTERELEMIRRHYED